MKAMTIKEIQEVNLQTLLHIQSFCKEHGIRWWLSDGTLLGAIRHHGFIPWDDDADISMPREDYDRFIREYVNSEKYKLYAPELQNCFLNYARLCEMKETFFQQNMPWTFEKPGVGIDIFPLDGCPDDFDEYVRFARRLVENREVILRLRSTFWPISFRSTPWGFIKDVFHAMRRLWDRIGRINHIQRCLKNDMIWRQQYALSESVHCSHVLGVYTSQKFWDSSWFEELISCDFCGTRFPIPAGYDFRLKAEYGDYMTLPPESKRKGHEVHQTMMWRD